METMPTVALLGYGSRVSTEEGHLFDQLVKEFYLHRVLAEPVRYHDAMAQSVRRRLARYDGILVWVNPVEEGNDRTVLNALLRDLSNRGIFVSAHPDIIGKMGTKEILFATRHMTWGGDVHRYRTVDQLRRELPARLADGSSRVLKSNRGNSGNGVWRVRMAHAGAASIGVPAIRVLSARRNSRDDVMPLDTFLRQCETRLSESDPLIDQAFYSPVPDGMVRCYLTRNRVVGFGHQFVASLLWQEDGSDLPQHQPRRYYPASKPEFQGLKEKLEHEWMLQLQRILNLDPASLPVIWDADFLCGPKTADGEETHVLCEINVSSVAPFPPSAVPAMVRSVVAAIAH